MRSSLIWLFVLIGSLPAAAQTTAAQLTGRITDASGSVVPGATVKATNTATQVSRGTVSNELGDYTIPLLEPGVYRIAVESTMKVYVITKRSAICSRCPP